MSSKLDKKRTRCGCGEESTVNVSLGGVTERMCRSCKDTLKKILKFYGEKNE